MGKQLDKPYDLIVQPIEQICYWNLLSFEGSYFCQSDNRSFLVEEILSDRKLISKLSVEIENSYYRQTFLGKILYLNLNKGVFDLRVQNSFG